MISLKATATEDLTLGMDGNLAFVGGVGAITQTVKQYVRARRGEMIHRFDQGVPYEAIIWGGSPNIAQFEAAARTRLLQTPDVLEVLSLQARLTDSVLSYTATIRTSLGEVTING